MIRDEDLKRFALADKRLLLAVADLGEVDRLRRAQAKRLDLAEADGNQIVHRDWHAAIKAVVAASAEYDRAEDVVERR